MKLGIQVSRFDQPGGAAAIGPEFAAIARTADDAGLDSLWVMDHFFQIPTIGPAEQPMLEAYTTLAFAAGLTRRLQLGALVTGVSWRHPGVLVKTVTTLDVLSGGRAALGLGAGWYEREHAGLGVPLPAVAERFARLEETLQIANRMWSGEVGAYSGTHYRLAETLCEPAPVSRPRPPILVGGGGERQTLRLTARYADAWNLFAWGYAGSPFADALAMFRHKRDVLRRHCDTIGRDFATLECSTLGLWIDRTPGPYQATPDEALRMIEQFAAAGVHHHIVTVRTAADVELLATAILPRIKDLVPGS